MHGLKTAPETKAEVIRLRVDERLSYNEIQALTGVSKGTLSGWLRDYPLTEEEKRSKMGGQGYRTPKKERGEESLLHQMVPASSLTTHLRAKVGEAAVLLRLILHGFEVYGSPFDGDKADWVVGTLSGKLLRIQVKYAYRGKDAVPTVGTRCTQGHGTQSPYQKGDFDILTGYDHFTDTVYVWTWEEVSTYKSSITVCPEAAERWDKLT